MAAPRNYKIPKYIYFICPWGSFRSGLNESSELICKDGPSFVTYDCKIAREFYNNSIKVVEYDEETKRYFSNSAFYPPEDDIHEQEFLDVDEELELSWFVLFGQWAYFSSFYFYVYPHTKNICNPKDMYGKDLTGDDVPHAPRIHLHTYFTGDNLTVNTKCVPISFEEPHWCNDIFI